MTLHSYPDYEAWKAERDPALFHIGGSDVAAIMPTVAAFRTPWECWAYKKGPIKREAMTPEMQRGIDREPDILRDYEYRTQATLAGVDDFALAVGVEPWQVGALDAYIPASVGAWDPPTESVIEAKTDLDPSAWGPDGTEILQWTAGSEKLVPPRVAVQCFWYLHCTVAEWCDIAVELPVSWGWPQLRIIRLHRDEAIQTGLVKYVTSWREKYLLGDAEPPMGGSRAVRQEMRARFPHAEKRDIRTGDDAEAELARELAGIEADLRKGKARKDELQAILMRAIGDDYAISWDGAPGRKTPKATFVRTKGKETISLAALRELHPEWAKVLEEEEVISRGHPGGHIKLSNV